MQFINNFDTLLASLKADKSSRVKVVVACPHDEHSQEAIEAAIAEDFADFILIGQRDLMGELANRNDVEYLEEPDVDAAAALAVKMVREGNANVLMKGLINTDNLLRAVLNKEYGILPAGHVLSHVTVSEIPGHPKLLLYSDVAVIPYPTLDQRIAIIEYVSSVCRALGIEQPRIGLLHFTEKTNPKFPITLDYAEIKRMAAEGRFGNAIIDGPMDLKTACDAESGSIKGIDSPIGGQADAVIVPDIQAGNILYKALTGFAHATNAGMLVGASAPVVVASRSDSVRSKLCSLALACLSAKK